MAVTIFRHLPYFLVVAEELHFQRAADRLRITQSALSRRIRLLEEELELQLFDRLSRGVRLTPAGESLFQDAQKIVYELDQATERARKITRGLMGKIDIGILPSVVSHPVVLKLFEVFRDANPDIQIGLKIADVEPLTSSLLHQEFDVGIYYRFGKQKDLVYSHICDDRLLLAVPRTHRLANKRGLKLEDFAEEPFVWPTRSVAPRYSDLLIAACNAHGFSPKIEIEAHTTDPIFTVIGLGLGVGFITEGGARRAPPSVAVCDVENLNVSLPLCMVWRSNYASPVLTRMVSALTEAKEEAPESG